MDERLSEAQQLLDKSVEGIHNFLHIYSKYDYTFNSGDDIENGLRIVASRSLNRWTLH